MSAASGFNPLSAVLGGLFKDQPVDMGPTTIINSQRIAPPTLNAVLDQTTTPPAFGGSGVYLAGALAPYDDASSLSSLGRLSASPVLLVGLAVVLVLLLR